MLCISRGVPRPDNNLDRQRPTSGTADKIRCKEDRISGFDINKDAVSLSMRHAKNAGVSNNIHFQVSDMRTLRSRYSHGVIVTNPPYGERIMEKQEAEGLYRDFGKAFANCPNWQLYLLSSHTEFERTFGRMADKKRKLYNGMIKCELFMYFK